MQAAATKQPLIDAENLAIYIERMPFKASLPLS